MRITLKRNILRAGGAAVALPMMESFTPFARAADGKRPVKRSGWVVHAYVLMGNHYRLLLETAEPDLVRGMTWFQTTDTVRYDVRHGSTAAVTKLFWSRRAKVAVLAKRTASHGWQAAYCLRLKNWARPAGSIVAL